MNEPRWIAPIYQEASGQDYRGLRLMQDHMVDFLLPGIITITPRARYYAFYAWLLVEYAQEHPTGWSFNRFIKRREQIFGLANVAYNGNTAGLAGSQTFLPHWQAYEAQAAIPLTADDYLQASRGGYDAYAGVMGTLELVAEHENQRGWEVTVKGQALAAAFAQAIANTDNGQRGGGGQRQVAADLTFWARRAGTAEESYRWQARLVEFYRIDGMSEARPWLSTVRRSNISATRNIFWRRGWLRKR